MKRLISIIVTILFVSIIANAQDTPSNEEIREIVTSANDPTIIDVHQNEDGWLSAIESYECTPVENTGTEYALDLLSIRDVQTSEIIWQMEQLISCGGLGTYGFAFVRWVDDSLYFHQGREGSVHGAGFGFVEPLYRYTVSEGNDTAEALGSALFSYQGEYLIGWTPSGTFTFHATSTNDSQSITLDNPNMPIANVLWLPDQSGVIVVQTDDWMQPTASLVTFINRQDMTQSLLVTTEN